MLFMAGECIQAWLVQTQFVCTVEPSEAMRRLIRRSDLSGIRFIWSIFWIWIWLCEHDTGKHSSKALLLCDYF